MLPKRLLFVGVLVFICLFVGVIFNDLLLDHTLSINSIKDELTSTNNSVSTFKFSEPTQQQPITSKPIYQPKCKYNFSIFNLTEVKYLFNGYKTTLSAECKQPKRVFEFNELFNHECYTRNYNNALILIPSSLGVQTEMSCIRPFDNQLFEFVYIKPWIQHISNIYNNTKYMFFITNIHTRLYPPYKNNSSYSSYLPSNVGRISVDSFYYYYRNKIDISLPTETYHSFLDICDLNTSNKKYLITFQGAKRNYYPHYTDPIYNKEPYFRNNNVRDKIEYIINKVNKTNEPQIKFMIFNPKRKQNNNIYDYQYADSIIYSHFCFVISGDRVWSYRLMEVLSAGCIPVIVSNGWILPFNNIINWNRFILRIDEAMFWNEIKSRNDLVNYLWNGNQTQFLIRYEYNGNILNWHKEIIRLYKVYFSNDTNIVHHLIESMYNRVDSNIL